MSYTLVPRKARGRVLPAVPVQIPTQLAITTQPAGAVSGSLLGQPVVEARDVSGVRCTGYTGNITVAIGSGSGSLAGTLVLAAVNGVAAFSDLAITANAPPSAFTLLFTANGLASATSSSFNVTAVPVPAWNPATDTAMIIGDQSAFYFDSIQLLDGYPVTWRPDTDVVAGQRVMNWNAQQQLTDIAIDATDPRFVTSAQLTATGFSKGYAILWFNTGNANFNSGAWFCSFVRGDGAMCLSRTDWLAAVGGGDCPVSSPAGVAASTGGIGYYNRASVGSGFYFECITSGRTGTTGGPTTTGSDLTDGTAHWKSIGLPATTQRWAPQAANSIQDQIAGKLEAAIVNDASGMKAMQTKFNNAKFTFSDGVIGPNANQFSSATIIKQFGVNWGSAVIGPNSLLSSIFINITGGTGWTVQGSAGNLSITSIDPTTGYATMSANLGTIGSTGGTGNTGINQQGNDYTALHITPPANPLKTVYTRAKMRMTTGKDGIQFNKWFRELYTGPAQAPQGSIGNTSACTCWSTPPSQLVAFSYIPGGLITGTSGSLNTGSFTTATVDGSDNTIIRFNATVMAGMKILITGLGSTPYYATYALATGVPNTSNVPLHLHTGSVFGPVVSVGSVGQNLGAGTYDWGFSGPDQPDVGFQPVAPFAQDLWDGLLYDHLWVYRPHSAVDVFDGTLQYWVAGIQVLWIEQSVIDVVPSGGAKRWCSYREVVGHPIGYGTGPASTSALIGLNAGVPKYDYDAYVAILAGNGDPADLRTPVVWWR